MSDAWNEIQALKSKKSSMRAKLAARKAEREAEMAKATALSPAPTTKATEIPETSSRSHSPAPPPQAAAAVAAGPKPVKADSEVERQLLKVLCDRNIETPVSSLSLRETTEKHLGREVRKDVILSLLEKFAARQLLSLKTEKDMVEGTSTIFVVSIDVTKVDKFLSAVLKETSEQNTKKRKRDDPLPGEQKTQPPSKQTKQSSSEKAENADTLDLESLLSTQSAKEKESKKMTDEILQLLSKPTAKEQILVERFSSQGGAQLQEFCQYGTKDECVKLGQMGKPCEKLHFSKIIHKHTDESLGDCSFLNTCFHMDTCKYVHYEIKYPEKKPVTSLMRREAQLLMKASDTGEHVNMFPPQWIQCDMRYLDMTVLGQCAVIMADPPWDIHMELPYGTMSDDEMRKLTVPLMQEDGFIFLWVTGRAMELGRECLELWGYKRIDEIIWVKTNQLQRIIRTGRTGHWLNHGKEHCLVGAKGNPKGVNKGLDCDVIVAEVRATSHKPDEIYGIIERLSPGTRKVELFGRPHNVQPNWITLGNQLEGVRLVDPEIVKRFREKYPDGNCLEPPKERPPSTYS